MRVTMWRTWMLTADVREAIVDQSRHEFVDDAIVGLATFFTRCNELQMPQKRELVAHRRHRQAKRVRQIADTKLFVRERVHQPQAKRIGEREKNFDGFGRGLLGW